MLLLVLAALLGGRQDAAASRSVIDVPVRRVRTDSIERLSLGSAEIAVAARHGLGIVVVVRGSGTPTVVIIPPDAAASWSAYAAGWLDRTRDAPLDSATLLRSDAASAPDDLLFFERTVVDGRRALGLYATDSVGRRGTVLELTESEARAALTIVWAVASEADSSLAAPETLGGDTVWTHTALTRYVEPRASRRTPNYPVELRRAEQGGSVVLSFVVDTTGSVITSSLEVLSSTHPDFSKSAVDFVRKSKFEPGQIGGRVVKSRVVVPFTYELQGKEQRQTFDVVRIADRARNARRD